MLGISSSSRLQREAQQHYSPKQVIHGAGVLLSGLQTRGPLRAQPQERCPPLRYASAESRGSRERGWANPSCAPGFGVQTVGAVLLREVSRGEYSSHGSPCENPSCIVDWLICPPPGEDPSARL